MNDKLKILLSGFLVFATLFSVTPFVFAHNALGEAMTETVDGQRIEFSYDLPEIYTNEAILFKVALEDVQAEEFISFDQAFVRISEVDGPVIWVSNLAENSREGGTAQFTGTLPSAGDYNVDVRFSRNGESFASASFNISAQPPLSSEEESSDSSGVVGMVLPFVVGIIAGGGAGWLLKD